MESVCGFRPGRGYACHVRLDSRRRMLGHAPVIRRSIWSGLLYFAGPVAGHMLMVRDPVARRRIEVEVYASGNFWLGA